MERPIISVCKNDYLRGRFISLFFDEIMQLLETIQVRDGQFQNIEYHNKRFNASRLELFGLDDFQDLKNLIKTPSECSEGIFRCRVVYEKEIQETTFTPYIYKEIKTLKMVDIGDWDYSYKYADRSFMTNLLAENKDFDEVIMIKNGFITDCTIANLAFWDGVNWFTPSTPLLKGTKRQQLIDSQVITETAIRVEDLGKYKGVCLINAFRGLSKTGFQPVFPTIR
jgi:4-amino-4-deoxychorismate lyase